MGQEEGWPAKQGRAGAAAGRCHDCIVQDRGVEGSAFAREDCAGHSDSFGCSLGSYHGLKMYHDRSREAFCATPS